MSRQERRLIQKMVAREARKARNIQPVTILNPDSLLATDVEELGIWKTQRDGYRKIHTFGGHLQQAVVGIERLGFPEDVIQGFIMPGSAGEKLAVEVTRKLPLHQVFKLGKLLKPIDQMLRGPIYTDEALTYLNGEYRQGNLTGRDYVGLFRNYSWEMQQAMQVYIDVLTPDRKKLRGAKTTATPPLKEQPITPPTELTPDIEPNFELQSEQPITDIQEKVHFFLEGKKVFYTTRPWSTRPTDLIELDTSSWDSYMEQFAKLVAGHVDSKPTSLGRAVDMAFNPDAFAHLQKAGLRHIPEGVDERWIRIKRGNDRIGFLPLKEDGGILSEAVVFVGHRAWVYDRVSK